MKAFTNFENLLLENSFLTNVLLNTQIIVIRRNYYCYKRQKRI
jgi:hypothetical protein